MTNRRALHRDLLRWYGKNGRNLPWRRTNDPYAILVSEMMLQQTQVATVLPYYRQWLKRFPDFAALAKASDRDALLAWQGLGYYNRARYLRRCARIVQKQYRGCFPSQIDRMVQLPGIGRYTAHAIATFAFAQPAPIVEANTARVLARLFNVKTPIDSAAGRNRLWNHAAQLLPKRGAAHFNSALLDLGALVCLPRRPRCTICPVKKFCRATDPNRLPIKRPRIQTKQLVEDHDLIVSEKRILLEQSITRWRDMWILPPLELRRFKQSSLSQSFVYQSVFPFTHHRITLRVFRGKRLQIANKRQRWFGRSELNSIPIPSPHRRAIEQILGGV